MGDRMNPRRVSVVLLLMALVATRLPGAPTPVGKPEKKLATFPQELAGWSGKDDPFEESVMAVVATDDDLHRLYRKDDKYLWIYVGYYGTRKGGRTGHLPHHCYPAAGYRIVSIDMVPLTTADGKTVPVNHLILEKGGKTTSTMYWVHSGEHQVLTDGWMMNLTRLRRRLLNGRDDGALVRVSGPVQGSLEETIERQKEFAQSFLATIPGHWPLEKTS